MTEIEMIERNVSLKRFNTFGIDVTAAYFKEFNHADELASVLSLPELKQLPILILGGGSNILFTKNFDGIVLKNNIPGIRVLEDLGDSVLVSVGSGVVWHELVIWCITNNFAGIENLSLIPGCTGAAPIQNIGAYGVELKDTFHSLEAMEISSGRIKTFIKSECGFGYRDSIFKNTYKGKLIITEVIFELSKTTNFKLSYGAIEQELKKNGVETPTLKAVSDAVCNIRRSKLPDPKVYGNAGSFFKNPEIPGNEFSLLKAKFPEIVAYSSQSNKMKLAAGWLIEQCGWKGKVIGNTGSHKDQALVLVNYGNASGLEILDLAMKIRESVNDKFGVIIEPEVNIM